MTKIASLSIAGALLALGFSAAPAQAQANRTFVSGTGTDSGTCERASPCQTFAFAITQTAAAGEIDVLDTADYGVLTIDKSISIVNDGAGVAGIQGSSGNGNAITINAGASDSIHLRGLTIEGLGSGANGIQFIKGGNLAIENCVVRNFAVIGISISPTTSSSFSVSNTIASNNPGVGIGIAPSGEAVVTGVLSKVTANNNLIGIDVSAANTPGKLLNVTIVDSEASNNANMGVVVISSTLGGGRALVTLRNFVASFNKVGLDAVIAQLVVAHSVVTGNNTGVDKSGGTIQSYGDNYIDGNGSDNTGVLTVISMH